MTHSDDAYLIVKRGLYYRPNSQGYTGLKSEAGRYSLDDVPDRGGPNREGITCVHEDDAPEYSPRCPWDVRLVDQTARKAIEVALNEAAELVPRVDDLKYLQFSHAEMLLSERRAAIRAISPDDILKKVKDNE